MAENLPASPETSAESHKETPETAIEHTEDRAEVEVKAAERAHDLLEQQAERKVEDAQPVKSEDLKLKQNLAESAQPAAVPAPTADKGQREQASRTYLSQVRKHMSGADKAFSEFVHNPTIDSLSEVAGKTIIRPSGILAGGIITLLGSAWYVYATDRTGFRYNFVFAFLLFVGGFALGLVLEMILKIFAKNKKAKASSTEPSPASQR